MRRTLSTVSVLCLTVVCLGCGSGDGGGKKGSAGSEAEPSFVEGLVTLAKDLWASQSEKRAEDGSHASAKLADPIVRCNVNGTIEFTNQSRCQNRGGHGDLMALKAKNDR